MHQGAAGIYGHYQEGFARGCAVGSHGAVCPQTTQLVPEPAVPAPPRCAGTARDTSARAGFGKTCFVGNASGRGELWGVDRSVVVPKAARGAAGGVPGARPPRQWHVWG